MRAILSKTNQGNPFDLFADFLSLFYPNYCLGCHNSLLKGEDLLCTACLSDLPKTNFHEQEDNPILKRLAGRIPLEFASAYLTFRKNGIVQQLLHELKYGNKPEVGVRLGKLYGKDLAQSGQLATVDLIVPVPLHKARQRKRGYNQSAMFASGLSDALGIPWQESVSVRVHATTTQTRKSRKERWQNVTDAFSVSGNAEITNKHLLLVDDVITTGATLEACGMHLLENGCSKLSIACIAAA